MNVPDMRLSFRGGDNRLCLHWLTSGHLHATLSVGCAAKVSAVARAGDYSLRDNELVVGDATFTLMDTERDAIARFVPADTSVSP